MKIIDYLSRYDNGTFCYLTNDLVDSDGYTKIRCGMERKGNKTKKYWPYIYCDQPTRKYMTGNILDAEPFIADTEEEAKRKLVAALDKHIHRLQMLRDNIQNTNLNEAF